MKKYALMLLLVLPLLVHAQVGKDKTTLSPGVQDSVLGTSFILRENTILFQKVYDSTLGKDDLVKSLKGFLPAVKSFQLTESPNQNEYQFSGKLNDYLINYRKYGGSLMGTSVLLNEPLNANVIIQVKDYKYRVLISDVVFKDVQLIMGDNGTDIFLDDMFTRKKRTEIRIHPTVSKVAKYMDSDFGDSFNVSTSKKASADF
jgi:hypothetical protein